MGVFIISACYLDVQEGSNIIESNEFRIKNMVKDNSSFRNMAITDKIWFKHLA